MFRFEWRILGFLGAVGEGGRSDFGSIVEEAATRRWRRQAPPPLEISKAFKSRAPSNLRSSTVHTVLHTVHNLDTVCLLCNTSTEYVVYSVVLRRPPSSFVLARHAWFAGSPLPPSKATSAQLLNADAAPRCSDSASLAGRDSIPS